MEELVIQEHELERLNNLVKQHYGVDFSNYAISSYSRRIKRIIRLYNLESINQLIRKLSAEPAFFEEFLRAVTVNTTEMFRDPMFWKALREQVIPEIARHDVIRVWHAGCSTGEEVFTTAILLKEAGIYDRVKTFATDLNSKVIDFAQAGRYSVKNIELYDQNYEASGGPGKLSDYYEYDGNTVQMDKSLLDNVTFKRHDLVKGGIFSKFDLILCRNVIIYFDRELQNRVFDLFLDSLYSTGFMGIGAKESLIWSTSADRFKTVNNQYNIFKID